jgi:DNA-binding NarL/FixJ family response regulator
LNGTVGLAFPPGGFLIVDDHPLFRHALSELLRTVFAGVPIRHAGSLAEGYAALVEINTPSAVLLDINLPDSAGADGLTVLRKASPRSVFVVVSAETQTEKLRRMSATGAHGFISKSVNPDRFITDLQTILGERVQPSRPSERAPPIQALTRRQQDVALEMMRGLSNKEIARSLGLGPETVKTHVSEVIRRLNARNRAHAVQLCATVASVVSKESSEEHPF